MQKLSMQRWVSSVRLVQQRLRQRERFVDRFGLQNFKWIMLKDGPNQDNFCKTAAMCRPAYPSPGYPSTMENCSIQFRPIKKNKVLVLTSLPRA